MKKYLLLSFLLVATFAVQAQQKIKDGTGTPATSLPAAGSILELQSTQAGLRMPQVSLTDTKTWGLLGSGAAATSPGMTVYNTNAAITNTTAAANYPALGKGEYYWDGTGWVVKNPVATAAYVEPWYNVATNTAATSNTQNIYQTGNVGIRTATPNASLHVQGEIRCTVSPGTFTGSLFDGSANTQGTQIVNTATDAYVAIQRDAFTGAPLQLSKNNGTGGQMISFDVAGVNIGRVQSTATSTAYLTTSDIRLKEDISNTHFGVADVMKIKVADYNYISDKNKKQQTGFLAQDLYKIYPDAVVPGGDDEKRNPWMIEYGKITPLLVKAIQDQQMEITELKAQIAELKALIKK